MRDHLTILLSEDSDDDADLIERALKEADPGTKLLRVCDGAEAIEYLEGRDKYSDRTRYPFPDILITDLKMPNVSGLDLLDWLQEHPDCSLMPAILISDSDLEKDVKAAYELGANTFFHKPASYRQFMKLVRMLHEYWALSELPAGEARR